MPCKSIRTPSPAWVSEVTACLPPLARLNEVASAIRMCPRTIRRLIACGRLVAIRDGDSGPARVLIPRAEVARYLTSLGGGAA